MNTTALVSSEFLALCQGQLSLLVQGVEASLAIVYLAEEWLGGQTSNLVPIVAYPDNAADILRGNPRQLPGIAETTSDLIAETLSTSATLAPDALPHSNAYRSDNKVASTTFHPLSPDDVIASSSVTQPATKQQALQRAMQQGEFDRVTSTASIEAETWEETNDPGLMPKNTLAQPSSDSPLDDVLIEDVLLDDVISAAEQQSTHASDTHFSMPEFGVPNFAPGFHQAVQPLYHENRPVGVLVMARKGKHWHDEDYDHLEQVAYTLSAACGMEHRLQWLQNRFQQQEIVQERQQDLLDNLIHQFRNPLTALRTFGKLLVRRLGPEDPNQRVAAGIVRESDRLQSLLKQINHTVDQYGLPQAEGLPASSGLNGTQSDAIEADIVEGNWEPGSSDATTTTPTVSPLVQSGQPQPAALLPAQAAATNPLTGEPLVLEACTVADVLGPLLESYGAIAQDRGNVLRLHVQAPQSPAVVSQVPFTASMASLAGAPLVQGNQEALREVISNLIDNGLKYGHPQGTVAVTVTWVQDRHLQLCISDDGPGIPQQDLPRLFERHYRGIQAEGDKPGTGLGLAIARALVEQMEGQLLVLSPAEIWHPHHLQPQPSAKCLPPPEVPVSGKTESEETTAPQNPEQPGSAFVIELKPWLPRREEHS